MLTLINKTDVTSYVPYETINISQTAGDPQGKATFQLVDPGSQISLLPMQEVIFIDETMMLGGVTLQPTHNYLNNNNFNYGGGAWATAGAFASNVTFPSSGTFGSGAACTITISNVAVGAGLAYQNIGKPYVIVGQNYCVSASMNITTAFTNAYAYIQIAFFDVNGTTLLAQDARFTTVTGGYTRVSTTATAPTNAVTMQIDLGVETTSTTNSGSVTWTAAQLEPVWFPALYAYPTPICDFLQANCVTLPDGTAARLDRIFTGNVTHLTASYEGTTRTWDVEVTSLELILENGSLVNATYDGVTDQSIITSIINNPAPSLLYAATPSLYTNTPQALAYRNVPICYAGVTVNDLQFADSTPREVLNALSDITGFLFGADPYYNCFYYPPFYNEAPYAFVGNGTQPDNVSTFGYYDYSIETDASQIQSAINVSGTTYALQVTESWHCQDGSHQEGISGGKTLVAALFHVPAQNPTPTIVVGGTSQPVAMDTGASNPANTALYNTSNSIVGFASSVSKGTSISITYTYTSLVYVQVEAPDSIAKFGRPMYSKINDTNLVNNAQAITEGEAQLQAYAEPRITLKFKTNKYLAPGVTITFTSNLDNIIGGHYTVQQVTATALGGGINQYEIEAGVYVDDFVDFFRNSQKAINRADHDPAEPIKQYNNLLLDSSSFTDSLSIHP